MTSLLTFQLHPTVSAGRTWNSSAPPCSTPPGSLLFSAALLSRQRQWLFKAKNAERGDTLERFSISSPASHYKCPRSCLSADPHWPVKPSTVVWSVQSDTSVSFRPVSLSFCFIAFLVFAHLPPPFRFCASCLLPGCCRSTFLYSSSVYCLNDSATATEPLLDAELDWLFPSILVIFVSFHCCHLRVSS